VSVSSDRLRAAHLLMRVERGDFAGPLLERHPGGGVRVRVLGVLRWLRLLDAALAPHLRRPLPRLDPEVRTVLRLGLFEAGFLGVPPPVATDGAVHLVRRLARSSAAGLVNAVLRRAVAELQRLRREAPLAVRLSHPDWMVERWEARWGEAVTRAILAANQEPAPLWVWFLDERVRSRLEAGGCALEAHRWLPGAWTAREGAAALAAAVAGGAAYAQDPASQLVAHLAARLLPEAGVPRVADVCAAPGGKSALLARLVPGTFQVAGDLRLARARLVRGLLSRAGAEALVLAADARRPPLPVRAFDLVLVDAPCTGTGTLRRHPELRWRLHPGSVTELAALQRDLLLGALELVRPGGVVLYTTCSLEPEENEEVVAAASGDVEPVQLAPLLPAAAGARPTPMGGAVLVPGADSDGFTYHALRYNPGQ